MHVCRSMCTSVCTCVGRCRSVCGNVRVQVYRDVCPSVGTCVQVRVGVCARVQEPVCVHVCSVCLRAPHPDTDVLRAGLCQAQPAGRPRSSLSCAQAVRCILLRLLLGGRCHSLSVHPRCCPHRRLQWGHGAPAVSFLMYNPDHRQTSVASEFTHLPGGCQRNTRMFKESTDLIIRDTYYKGHYTQPAD